jgi:hypothetical protein
MSTDLADAGDPAMHMQTGNSGDFMQAGLCGADHAACLQLEDLLWIMPNDPTKQSVRRR